MAALLVLTCSPLHGQAQTRDATSPSFEVASVKLDKSGDPNRTELGILAGGTFTATNVPLKQLILLAYGLQEFQLAGATDWMDSERFDIIAKAGHELTPGAAPPELRALLAERFALKTHRETREAPIYALMLARSDGRLWPALHPLAVDYCKEETRSPRCVFRMGGGTLTGRSIGIGGPFVQRLSSVVNRTVVDRSGLNGVFDYDLTWSPDQTLAADLSMPSIFTALQEQLGLKLEPQRGPVEMLVIEGAERLVPD